MPGFGDILGEGSAARQFLLYGVAFEVARILMAPFEDAVTQRVYEANPVQVTSPAQLADEVVRAIVTEEEAAAEAARSGVNAERFHRMVLDTGEPPGLDLVLEMYRRNIVPLGEGHPGEASVRAAIRTSRVRPEWEEAILAARVVPLPPSVAVDAVVESQVDMATAQAKAYESGVSAEDFAIMVHTRGNPPGPSELLEMHRRGIIPLRGRGPDAISVEQGIAEGATKNKWFGPITGLLPYVPPPRTITALEREGAISPQEAVKLYAANGLDPQLAAVYSAAASTHRTATAKQLGETRILALYDDKLITQPQAEALLVKYGYTKAEADLILAQHTHDSATRAMTHALNRVRALYTGRHITRAAALRALDELKVPQGERTGMLESWDLEQAANVRNLTPAQVADLWHLKGLTQDEAMSKLEALGYTPFDAWGVLSIHAKALLPGRPSPGPGPFPPVA